MSKRGTVLELYIADSKNQPMTAVESVQAIANRGLVGDRYYFGTGHYSNIAGWGANVTLIQSEGLLAVNVGHQTDFTGEMLRRNIVTGNIKLDSLIGREFRIGSAVLRGTKHFPPCAHLAYLLGRQEVLKYFAYCGGIGAEVVVSGIVSIGDAISLIDLPGTGNSKGDLPCAVLPRLRAEHDSL